MRGLAETASFVRRNRASCAGLRVLLYHSVSEHDAIGSEGIFCIKTDLFESHMITLSKMPEFDFVTIQEGFSSIGRFGVAVSFDDGYKDNLYNVVPLMERYSIPFTVFVTASNINKNCSIYLTPSELRELSSFPFVTIGSHGLTHNRLTECDSDMLRNELVSSRHLLEDITGNAVTTLAYPHGAVDKRVKDAAEKAGYLLAVCSRFDINDASRDPLLLCRTEITGNDSVRVFQQKLHGDWDWYRWRRKDPALIY